MKPIPRIGLLAVGLLLVFAATFPLALVGRIAGPLPTALSAEEVRGSVWRGALGNARWNGRSLGDVQVGLRPWPLLLGRTQVRMATPRLTMLVEDGRRRGLSSAHGTFEIPLAVMPGAVALVEARDATLLFSDQRCIQARGQVVATLQLRLADVPKLRVSGKPACEGAEGHLRLTTDPTSAVDLEMLWTVRHDGSHTLRTRVRSEDPATRLALQFAGFQASPDGLVRNDAGGTMSSLGP